MSYVSLFIIKDDCVYYVNVHYKTAKKLINGGWEKLLPLLKSHYLDSGYIVLDFNQKTIINVQSAFHIDKIADDFTVIEG